MAVIGGIFTYGTLMRGEERHHVLEAHGPLEIEPGWVTGTLIDLGEYPALVDGGDGRVHGELVRVEPTDWLLSKLDWIEDYDPARPEGSLYLRVVREVTVQGGQRVDAYTYVYNRAPIDGRVIASGDWRNR